MRLLQPRYPNSKGGRLITFLRVVQMPSGGLVIKVINANEKRGEGIAICTVEERQGGSFRFTTTTKDAGHKKLCCLLRSEGVKGNYISWLEAVENDDPKAWEKEQFSGICFECDLVEEGETLGWKVE